MYPDSLLQWLGYLAVVFGVLVGVGALGWWVHHKIGAAGGPHPQNPDDEIPDRIDDLPE